MGVRGKWVRMLFVGDDWAEDHHDIEIVDETGRRLARAGCPKGSKGSAGLHALIAAAMPEEWADLEAGEAAGRVKVGIETERGPWVAALVAAGYEVFAINPMSKARYRGAALDLGGEERPGRCARAGRDRPAGPCPPPPGRRRHR